MLIGSVCYAAAPALLLAGFHYRKKLGRAAPLGLAAIFAVAALIELLLMARNLYWQMAKPPEWNFLAFWVWAQAGAAGLDFYRAESFTHIMLPYPPSAEFRDEIMRVGMFYPPITMLLLAPLGWVDMFWGYLLWHGLQFLAMAASVVLLWRLFLRSERWEGLALTLALATFYLPTRLTFSSNQTNFLSLLAFLAFWMYRNSIKGGAALALGMMVKPYFAALLLFPVLKRHFRAATGFLAVMLLLCGMVLVGYGQRPFLSYLSEKPQSKFPAWVFSENVNQSLSAFFLREHALPLFASPISTFPYLLGCLVLGGLTAWAVARAPRDDSDWALCLTLVFTLIAYPGSLTSYGVMALPGVFLIWSRRDRIPGKQWTALAVITAVYAFAQAHVTLAGHVTLWLALLWMAPGLPWSRRPLAPDGSFLGGDELSFIPPGGAGPEIRGS
ncbi:MAG: glycosyltransferase family 87 protein [Fibrobacteria bacterium]